MGAALADRSGRCAGCVAASRTLRACWPRSCAGVSRRRQARGRSRAGSGLSAALSGDGQGRPERAGAALAAQRHGAAECGVVERSFASDVTAVGAPRLRAFDPSQHCRSRQRLSASLDRVEPAGRVRRRVGGQHSAACWPTTHILPADPTRLCATLRNTSSAGRLSATLGDSARLNAT